ncbi:MAG: FAD-binding oxidoreductase [Pirellula sp.]|jgi:glycine/D-amino acid oxidase-like deaminating enzyme|nr:FAD-binding oxidoreductase [Pirellula sp.]
MLNRLHGDEPPSIAIIGCGLAGAAVAWQAIHRGWSITVIDRADSESCSRVAAGLVTPITGGRAAASWQWDLFFPMARTFYKRIEQTTGGQFWHEQPALKVFQSAEEQSLFQNRWNVPPENETMPSVQPFDRQACPVLNMPFSAALLQPAARLETSSYLDATKDFLQRQSSLHEMDLDCDRDIVFTPQPKIAGLDGCFDAIFFCQGFAARENRWFRDLPLHPARGDILKIAAPPAFPTDHVVHHSAWIVPDGNGELLLGATYDRKTLDGVVDDRAEVVEARVTLLDRFRELLAPPSRNASIKVLKHRAAVRPASYDRHPLIGQHREHPSLFCLNGLGSKGSLMSPLLADALLNCMNGKAIPKEWDWNRMLTSKSLNRNENPNTRSD